MVSQAAEQQKQGLRGNLTAIYCIMPVSSMSTLLGAGLPCRGGSCAGGWAAGSGAAPSAAGPLTRAAIASRSLHGSGLDAASCAMHMWKSKLLMPVSVAGAERWLPLHKARASSLLLLS